MALTKWTTTRLSCLILTGGKKVTTGCRTDGLGRPTISAWQRAVPMGAHIQKCLAHYTQRLHCISFSYGKTLQYYGNPNAKYPPQGKVPTFGGSRFATHDYISTRPPLFADTHNSSALALQSFKNSLSNLTFGGPLAGTTLVLSIKSSLCLCYAGSVKEHVRTVRLTNDFCIISQHLILVRNMILIRPKYLM